MSNSREKNGSKPVGKDPDKTEITVNLNDLANRLSEHLKEELKAAILKDNLVLVFSGIGTNVEEFKKELEKLKDAENE